MQQTFSDYDIDDAIHNRERNYKLFLKIVGENPLDQIDWIIENGLDKFNYWFRCYETGKIYSPATVKEEQITLRGKYVVEEYSLLEVLSNKRNHVTAIDLINGGYSLEYLELTKEEISQFRKVFFVEIESEKMEFRGGKGNDLLLTLEEKKPRDVEIMKVSDKMSSCILLGHKWRNYNQLESQCDRCGKFKIFYGYAETEVYKNAIKPKGV
ncbi:hypothetical protein ABEY43_06975 [Priestia megaterium]